MNDTIAAISTPIGTGAIAIVRLSGPDSFGIADKIFKGKKSIDSAPANQVINGFIISNDSIIDQVLVSKFKSPNSFTGENIVEINCHGGTFIVQEILKLIIAAGARHAEPGEFTKRAFINGKMDLVQAEAVADLIHAQTNINLRLSVSQLEGKLSDTIHELKDNLKKQCSLLEIELDFSEEDIEFAKRDDLLNDLVKLETELEKLSSSFIHGRLLREGAHIAIVGQPNVGKSSILNMLLKQDRAIVSSIPGTTRDTLEESLDIKGFLFKVTDTAGIRETDDLVENKGVNRSNQILKNADIILLIVDSSLPDINSTKTFLDTYIKTSIKPDQMLIVVFNKIDIVDKQSFAEYKEIFNDYTSLEISAKTGFGFSSLEDTLVSLVSNKPDIQFNNMLTKMRHYDSLNKSLMYLKNAIASLKENFSPEFVSFDLRASLDALGEITGEVTTDEILNDIFSSFCIGK